jgi:hypothetical protein
MPTLKVSIDPVMLKALIRHAETAVDKHLLAEEEAGRAVIDEIADRGLKVEIGMSGECVLIVSGHTISGRRSGRAQRPPTRLA